MESVHVCEVREGGERDVTGAELSFNASTLLHKHSYIYIYIYFWILKVSDLNFIDSLEYSPMDMP